ncbi:MAG: hypothetical protein IKE75_03720 [Bacilli bacterium]|nr:hypothetical protein [Bacilli bacterium]
MDNFEWPDMPVIKVPQRTLDSIDDDYGKSHLSTENIYDFLKYCHKNGTHKLAGIITNKQRVFNIALESDHWSLESEILGKVYPKRKYSFNNPYDDGVTIFAVGVSDVVINLPSKLSQIQYESVLKIIEQVHQFEKDYDTKVKYFDDDYTLEEAKKRLSQIKPYDDDEQVVGIPLTEELPKELFEEKKESKNKIDWFSWDSADDIDYNLITFANNEDVVDIDAWPTFDDEVQINEYVEKDENKENEIREFTEITDLEKQNQDNMSRIHSS